MPKAEYRWLDRRIAHPGPYLALCLSDEEFQAAMRHLKIKSPPDWIKSPQAHATVHYCTNPKGELSCVVCMAFEPHRDSIEIAGLLVHEAVHIWQEYAGSIGEANPGREQEAYAVQCIAQELMAEYRRRVTALETSDAAS